MHTFTALYDHQADAEATQDELERLGIVETDHELHGAYEDKVSNPWAGAKGVAPPAADQHIYKEAMKRAAFY